MLYSSYSFSCWLQHLLHDLNDKTKRLQSLIERLLCVRHKNNNGGDSAIKWSSYHLKYTCKYIWNDISSATIQLHFISITKRILWSCIITHVSIPTSLHHFQVRTFYDFFSASYFVLRYVRFMIYNYFIKENIVWTSSFHISFSSFPPLFNFHHHRHLHVSWCSIFCARMHFYNFTFLNDGAFFFIFFSFFFISCLINAQHCGDFNSRCLLFYHVLEGKALHYLWY